MDILAHGIDVVDIESFSQLLCEPEADFVSRHYTQSERLSVDGSTNATQRLAGKFAAKEAVVKALGVGFDGTIAPADIEVVNTNAGAPIVILHGEAASRAAQLNISRWLVSISHSQTAAVASAIAIGWEADASLPNQN